MHDSSLYTDHEDIASRLARVLKESNKTIDDNDIIAWCQEVETEFCPDQDNMAIYECAELPVNDHKAKVPCNTYRILAVYSHKGDPSSLIPYKKNKNGGWISLSPDSRYQKIYVDYVGTPIDHETGLPLIIKGHEQACYWYCMFNIFFPDSISNPPRISPNGWQNIQNYKENEILAARGVNLRHKDKADIRNLDRIKFELIRVPGHLRSLYYGR